MESLVWEEKLDRIKALSGRKASGFIHEECFNTHIPKSVLGKCGRVWFMATVLKTVESEMAP